MMNRVELRREIRNTHARATGHTLHVGVNYMTWTEVAREWHRIDGVRMHAVMIGAVGVCAQMHGRTHR